MSLSQKNKQSDQLLDATEAQKKVGWKINFNQLQEIKGKTASLGHNLDEEQIEVVIIAMFQLGFVNAT